MALTQATGRAVHPGVVLARARTFDPVKLFQLHHRLSDLQVVEVMQSFHSTLKSLEPAGLEPWRGRDKGDPVARALRDSFLSAVERALRRDGGGLAFAVATVRTWYGEGVRLSPVAETREAFEGLSNFAESVLEALQAGNRAPELAEPAYIALASSLTLPEAMNLGPGLAGLAVGEGNEGQIQLAARLLNVPAVIGIPTVSEFTRDGDVIRLDGSAGTLDIVARMAARE